MRALTQADLYCMKYTAYRRFSFSPSIRMMHHFGIPSTEVRLGTIPAAGGTQRLPRLAGKSVAMEMILAGRSLSAHEALKSRIVSKVLPNEEDLRREILGLGEKIAMNRSGANNEWKRILSR